MVCARACNFVWGEGVGRAEVIDRMGQREDVCDLYYLLLCILFLPFDWLARSSLHTAIDCCKWFRIYTTKNKTQFSLNL